MTSENKHIIISGELALILVVIINSFGVVLMLYSGSGISAISSVPYAFSEVIKNISLGTFTYIFQTLLVIEKIMCDFIYKQLYFVKIIFLILNICGALATALHAYATPHFFCD
ncbi:DUF6198 family protein [Brachyspira pulli]